ncbi:hypothetical protein BJ508DRAFT_314502 [Ascobolus immersus RN42]|uniref:DUF676 domain-containing protein n=1 Tax=Ascobolus immersus RN42 TaxID=1160509 RepID=A0A3N4HI95_ASCIM|nr:hypothetical protein BJ508DRAFT_314502 [Ascobolus immersus RN42]
MLLFSLRLTFLLLVTSTFTSSLSISRFNDDTPCTDLTFLLIHGHATSVHATHAIIPRITAYLTSELTPALVFPTYGALLQHKLTFRPVSPVQRAKLSSIWDNLRWAGESLFDIWGVKKVAGWVWHGLKSVGLGPENHGDVVEALKVVKANVKRDLNGIEAQRPSQGQLDEVLSIPTENENWRERVWRVIRPGPDIGIVGELRPFSDSTLDICTATEQGVEQAREILGSYTERCPNSLIIGLSHGEGSLVYRSLLFGGLHETQAWNNTLCPLTSFPIPYYENLAVVALVEDPSHELAQHDAIKGSSQEELLWKDHLRAWNAFDGHVCTGRAEEHPMDGCHCGLQSDKYVETVGEWVLERLELYGVLRGKGGSWVVETEQTYIRLFLKEYASRCTAARIPLSVGLTFLVIVLLNNRKDAPASLEPASSFLQDPDAFSNLPANEREKNFQYPEAGESSEINTRKHQQQQSYCRSDFSVSEFKTLLSRASHHRLSTFRRVSLRKVPPTTTQH